MVTLMNCRKWTAQEHKKGEVAQCRVPAVGVNAHIAAATKIHVYQVVRGVDFRR